jgi:hypothetical protein
MRLPANKRRRRPNLTAFQDRQDGPELHVVGPDEEMDGIAANVRQGPF